MADPVRFPANLPYYKWPNVSGVFTLMQAGDWAAVEAYYKDPANTQNINDSIGAGNSWYNQFNPTPTVVPTKPPTLGMNETLPWFPSPAGQVNVTTATAGGGKVSASASSGGIPMWISFDPTFPNDPNLTSYGAGTTGYLYPADGQKIYSRQTGADVNGAPDIRMSMESL